MNKVLVDTNVLVYALDADSMYFQASQIFLLDTSNQLFTTSKNIAEFLSVVTRFPNRISIEQALIAVNDFTRFIQIIFPDNHSFAVFQKLLIGYKTSGLMIHDMEIASIALSNNIVQIATFNKKDFAHVKELQLIDLLKPL